MGLRVAVVAHAGKTMGGGLDELSRVLAARGHRKPLWLEVSKSAKAPKAVRRALKQGADLVLVWGGDGMVQHAIDALRGSGVPLAILPAGTANLLATRLAIPQNVKQAVGIALGRSRLALDVGVMNEEAFAVMAGGGADAVIIKDVDGTAKNRLGRMAYLRSGVRALRAGRVRMKIRIDGAKWFSGPASTVLVGNVDAQMAGLRPFPKASPVDGLLDVVVITANGRWQWARVLARLARGSLERSPFAKATQAKRVVVEFGRKLRYELDGGARRKTRRLEIEIEPKAVTVCVPRSARRKPTPS